MLDALDGDELLAHARDRSAVGQAGARPAGLKVIPGKTGADGLEQLELTGDEGASANGGDVGVEERVDVGGGDVEDGAEVVGVVGQDVERFGGSDEAAVAGGSEGGAGLGDEVRQSGGAAVVVEDGFVADHDHLDAGPVAAGPGGDFGDLRRGVAQASSGDENAEDEFQPVGFGCRADVLKARAVGAIEPDAAEAFGRDRLHIRGDGRAGFTGAVAVVGRVGHAPLRSAGAELGFRRLGFWRGRFRGGLGRGDVAWVCRWFGRLDVIGLRRGFWRGFLQHVLHRLRRSSFDGFRRWLSDVGRSNMFEGWARGNIGRRSGGGKGCGGCEGWGEGRRWWGKCHWFLFQGLNYCAMLVILFPLTLGSPTSWLAIEGRICCRTSTCRATRIPIFALEVICFVRMAMRTRGCAAKQSQSHSGTHKSFHTKLAARRESF